MKTNYKKKKLTSFITCFAALLTPVCMTSQVNVTASAGSSSSSYINLNLAFDAINQGVHQGIINILVVGNTTEPSSPTALLASGGTAAYTSITIKPFGGNFTINSATFPTSQRGILELTGADHVTIDGDDPLTPGAQNLSIISNTTTNPGVACIRLSSNSTTGLDGANDNIIRNCIIKGSRNSVSFPDNQVLNYGIQFSNGTGVSTLGGAYSSTNTIIQNNIVMRCYYGIHAVGTSTTYLNAGTQIIGNTIGSANSTDAVAFRGIDISHTSMTPGAGSVLISENDVRTGFITAPGNMSSIEIMAANAGALITRNNIHESINTTVTQYGMYGIFISTVTANDGIRITNNFIRDIQSAKPNLGGGATGAYGIYVTVAVTNLIINNNTIVQRNPAIVGTCVQISSNAATISQFMNNILVNEAPSVYSRCVQFNGSANISGATVNNNNYYVNPAGNLGYFSGTAYANLAAWRTGTSKDANSLNEYPTFVSATDLHLLNSAIVSTNLESGGAATGVTGVIIDIDGQPRPGPAGSVNGGGTAPDIGADEFDGKKITCPAPVAVAVSGITFNSAVITWTNGGTEQSWILGNIATPVNTIMSLSSPKTLTSLVPSTIYSVQVRAYCGVGDTSNWTLAEYMTLCLPPAIISVSNGSVCVSGSPTLNVVTSGTSSVNWYTSAMGGSAISTNHSFITPPLSASTNYYVAAFGSTGGLVGAGKLFTSAGAFQDDNVGVGIVFEALTDFILQSVVVYPIASSANTPGTITIGLCDASGTILQSVTQNVTGNPTAIGQTINLSFKIIPGKDYKLVLLSFTGVSDFYEYYNNNNNTFPLVTSGVVSLTSGYWSAGNNFSTYYYFYEWQLQLGCEGPRTPVAAIVNPKPSVHATALSNAVCEGDPINLVSFATANSFTWEPSGSNHQNTTVQANVSTVFTVSAESFQNCASTSTVLITVNPKPTVNVASSNGTICSGSTASLTASGNLVSYTWSNSGGTNAMEVVKPITNTTYSVTGTDMNGCKGVNTVFVQVDPLPALVLQAARTIICENETVRLYAVSPATSYSWSNGATTSVIVVSPTVSTTYSLTANTGVCSSKSSVTILVNSCTGIKSVNGTSELMVYPNPVNEVLTISYSSDFSNGAVLEIFDALGKRVFTQTLSQEETTIRVDTLERGVYFYRLNEGSTTLKTGKIIKQ